MLDPEYYFANRASQDFLMVFDMGCEKKRSRFDVNIFGLRWGKLHEDLKESTDED